MASTKGRILRLFSKLALEQATVVSVQDIGGFKRVLLKCNTQNLSAGMKVQLLLPSTDTRTYTPIPAPEGMVLLGWKHAHGPGAHWMTNAKVGEELPFAGPQRSLQPGSGPLIVIGDETSVATAAAFALARGNNVRVIIQSNSATDVYEAAASVGLREVNVISSGDTTATVAAVKSNLSTFPNAAIALIGGSELVINVRNALRSAGVNNIKTKTYWIPGRTGLD
jgi:NADPH-dependent ferric siderophore reductase